MNRFRGIEKARLTLFLLPLLLASFIPPALALPSYLPGVRQGDSWTYGDWNISCSYFCPPDFVGQLGQIASYQILVENVTGFNVGLNQTFTYYNGSSVSTTGYANTESYGGFFLIARGLIKGDHVYNSTSAPTINDTVSQFYAGADRQVNVLNYTQYQSSGNATFAYFWDQPTGILLQISEVFSFPNPNGPNGSIILDARVTTTNLWAPTLPDFSLSSTPLSPTTISAGGSATATITLTSLQSFSGPVTVSATVTQSIPDHPVSIANPPTVTLSAAGTGHSALTVTTTTSTTPGVYNVVIIANYTKTVVHFTTLDLIFTGPDFSISANPSSLTIPSGGTNFSTITIQSLQGFTGTVALSLQPSNLQLSLSTYSVSLSADSAVNSTLTITVPLGTNYYGSFTVTGSSGFLYHQVQGSVYVTPAAPPDINITASPSLLVFQPGSVGVSIITLASLHGFTGTVNLSATSEFVTTTLSVNNLTLTPNTGTASAVLTITAPTQAGPGNWTFDVYARGPGVYGSAQVTARISPATPQFTMFAYPEYFPNIAPGSVETSSLSFNSFGGYADTLNLIPQSPTTSCEPSISPTVGTVQLPAGGTVYANVTINVPSCTSPGDYLPTLWATGTQQPLYYETGTFLRVNGTSTQPDFTLTTTPQGIIDVPRGSAGNFTVTVKSINGFSGPVTVVPNGELGQVVTPSTFSLTPGSSQNVTVSVGVSNGYGGCCFGLGVLATSGVISHTTSTTISLNVTNPAPGPAFTLTASPGGMQLVEGHPQNVTVTVGSTGFYGTVNLSSQFDPQHFTVKFSQSSVTLTTTNPTATVQMTVNNSTSDSVGAWTIMVSGRGGTVLQSAQVQLNVTSTTEPDFRITSSPPNLLLLERTYGKVDLTVTSVNGFTGNVLLLGALVANGSVFLSPGSVVKTTLWILPTDNLQAGVNYGFGATGISGTTIRGSTILVDITPRQDFTINASPTSLSFLAGSSGSSILTVSSLGGFTGTVSLAVKSYPSGLSVSLGANSIVVPANGQNTAGVLVGGSVPGSYVVVVDTTSGGVTRSVAIPVTITQVTQFSITATPSSLTIPEGGQSSAKITVKSMNGFAGKVSLSAFAFNFPQLSLSASSVTLTAGGNANVTLTVPVPSSVGTGPYQVGVSGNTSTSSGSLILPVTVTGPLNNFSVSANPSLLPVPVGTQSASIVTVTANSGFTGTVTLTNSTSTPPPRCSLSQNIITLTGTQTFGTSTLTCTGSTPGTSNVTITGMDNGEQHSTVVTVFVPRIAYVPGLTVGQTVSIYVADLTWTSTIPKQYLQEPSVFVLLNDTAHIDLTVNRVSGSNVTIQLTWYFNNGTAPTTGYYSIDVVTGAYNSTGVVPLSFANSILATGLQVSDHVYETPYSPTINMTTTRTLLGTIRTVNFLNMTMTSPNTVSTVGFVTDQISGMFVGANAQFTINGGTLGTAEATLALRLNSTNIWTTSSKPSVAIIGITPNPATTGQQVTVYFTVSSSTTVSGITVNWGDGTTNTLLGSATTDTHVYANTGTQTHSAFTVNVTATNAAGHASATTVETVNDIPPTVTISSVSPNPASTGQTVTVAFSGTDPDGTVASYTINWGDSSPLDTLSGAATSDTHTYTSPGPYTVTVTATDNSGSTGQNTGPVTIQAPVPTVTIGGLNPNPADTGGIVTVSFSVSSTTTVTGITVNWGDGSTPDSLSVSATSDTHTYSNTGNAKSQSFTMTVTATNSAGPGSNSATETINDRPPTVTVSNVSPNPASAGTIVTVAFSATDPDGTIASFSVNWGDGNTDTVISGTATSDTHHYGNAGSFIITVTATDNSGSGGTNSKSMTVNGPGKTTASLSVSCSLNSIASGASTSCTVTVTGSSVYPPSGVVTLSTNSTTGAFTPSTSTCTLNTSGTCSVTYTDTATSSRTALISAAYPGDTYNTGATGGFSLKVVKPSAGLTTASLTVACSASTIQVGSFTTCTGSVTGSTPTGSVTLSANSATGYFTPSNGQCTLASGSCAVTYTDTATANVTVRIYAQYAGDTYNTVAYTNFTLTLVKPSTTLAIATTPVTITSGTATADQTATTGIYVQITGSTATNGTPAAINTKDLSAPSIGVGAVSLSGAKYYDVVVTGITSGNAKVCINYATASSTTTMQYWSGTAWTDATGVTVNGGTVCGQIPVSALTGTNITVGNAVQPAPSQPNNSNLLLIIAIIVAIVVIVAVATIFLKRKGRTTQASRTAQP